MVLTGTSIACLTYIGFDGISTLSEEVENPRRNILLATVLTCLVTGIISALTCTPPSSSGATGRASPTSTPRSCTCRERPGAAMLFVVVNAALLVANVGSGTGAHLGAARLLYGMGRDDALPRSFFGKIDPRRNIPQNNVLLVGALALIGGFLLTYQLGAEMLNFGAFIAFMGVNVAAFMHYWVRGDKAKRTWLDFVLPLLGFLICLYIWLSLRWQAKLFGGLWLLVGILYGAVKTRGFRKSLVSFELPPE